MRSMMLAALLVTTPATAALTLQDARLAKIASAVDAARMKATVEKLVSFGTRHTLSSQTDPKRGIGASLRWTEAELRKLGLEVVTPSDTVSGKRVPVPVKITNVLAIQRGTERPNDVVIISGHIDSRVSDVMNAAADAPGANDDGSGVAAVIESARILSKHKFPGTIVYALLSGEEQGLFGGKLLADYVKAQGWNVVANLNNDIIGNSCGSDKVCDSNTVRVFSEGPRWQGREALAAQQRSLGGENDSPSRNISRFLDSLAERHPEIGLDVMQVWRNDRFGRGGDHTELLNAGYPAVRFSVAVENYDQQHQDVRKERRSCNDISRKDKLSALCVSSQTDRLPLVEFGDTADKMNFAYLSKVTRLNVAAIAAIASAPRPPEPRVEGAVTNHTVVEWTGVGASQYLVRWRRSDASKWQQRKAFPGGAFLDTGMPTRGEICMVGADDHVDPKSHCQANLPGIRVDDWVFGVSSVSKDGFESPVASAVPGGAFRPYVAPVEKK